MLNLDVLSKKELLIVTLCLDDSRIQDSLHKNLAGNELYYLLKGGGPSEVSGTENEDDSNNCYQLEDYYVHLLRKICVLIS